MARTKHARPFPVVTLPALAPALLALAACAGDGAGPAPVLAVADSPAVRIGVADGASEEELHLVSAIRLLSDGRLLVADAGPRLRVYGAGGEYLRSVGGSGDEPGELRSLSHVQVLPGDSILVQDAGSGRVTVFDSAGEAVRTFPLEGTRDGPPGTIADVLSGGALLVWRRLDPSRIEEAEPGFRRDSVVVYMADREGRELGEVGTFPDEETLVEVHELDGYRGFTVTTGLFARGSALAAHGDRIYVGDTAVPDIVVYDTAGTPVDTLRTGLEPRPVTDADVTAAIEQRLEGYRDENARRAARQRLREMPRAATLPAYAALAVDPEGLVWVLEYQVDWDAPQVWRVYDPAGGAPAEVRFPARFIPMALGEDVVAGEWRDASDVEYVWAYPLERG